MSGLRVPSHPLLCISTSKPSLPLQMVFTEDERQGGEAGEEEMDISGFHKSLLSITASQAFNVTTDVTTQGWNENVLAKAQQLKCVKRLCFDCTSESNCRIIRT